MITLTLEIYSSSSAPKYDRAVDYDASKTGRDEYYLISEAQLEAGSPYWQNKIALWEKDGRFTPGDLEKILERLTQKCHLYMYEGLFTGLQSVISQVTVDPATPGLDLNSFTSLLVQKIAIPAVILQEASPILFHLLGRTAHIPFPSQTPPSYLDADDLTRGVFIHAKGLNPLDAGCQSLNYICSRRRTKQDGRRVIFQGIGHPRLHNVHGGSAIISSVTHGADPVSINLALALEEQDLDFFIDVSAEDARTTDLLDALIVSQPDQSPGISEIPRSFFKSVAEALLPQESLPRSQSLQALWVSEDTLRTILHLAVSLEETDSDSEADSSHGPSEIDVDKIYRKEDVLLEDVFGVGTQTERETGVGWNKFSVGISRSLPDFVEQLGEMYRDVFDVRVDYEAEAAKLESS